MDGVGGIWIGRDTGSGGKRELGLGTSIQCCLASGFKVSRPLSCMRCSVLYNGQNSKKLDKGMITFEEIL